MKSEKSQEKDSKMAKNSMKSIKVKTDGAENEISITEIEILASKILKGHKDGLSAIKEAFRDHPNVEHEVTYEDDQSELLG